MSDVQNIEDRLSCLIDDLQFMKEILQFDRHEHEQYEFQDDPKKIVAFQQALQNMLDVCPFDWKIDNGRLVVCDYLETIPASAKVQS